ncbi:hypothetical protein WOC76_23545 [Methylocystis sp. IM3]|uniref:hypothetical protein n=1 Tax=unclassified Methylocystis TaxID=2625913 RepID=UPI0031199327
MSDGSTPRPAEDAHEKLDRDELLTRLRDVTDQRDKLLSQFEAMALQVDESVREIDDAQLDAQHNAQQAHDSARRAEAEAARAEDLVRQLDEERRRRDELAAEFDRFRETAAHRIEDDPWGLLWAALAQILHDAVAWLRAKLPPDSALLPWFDRTVEGAKTAFRLAVKAMAAFFDWAKPHALAIWARLRAEAARLMGGSQSGPR